MNSNGVKEQIMNGYRKNEKLVNVFMFTRHGARTPYFTLPCLNQDDYKPEMLKPYVNANYELKTLSGKKFEKTRLSKDDEESLMRFISKDVPRGQLTTVGEMRHYELGSQLRQKYINEMRFLSGKYDPNEIYIRSTHYQRTINSAKAFAAGFYALSPNENSNEPFEIHVDEMRDDSLFPAPSYKQVSLALKCLTEYSLQTSSKGYLDCLKEIKNELVQIDQTNAAQDNSCKLNSLFCFREDLISRQANGLAVPKNLEGFIKKCNKYGNRELTAVSKYNIKLACGRTTYLLRENILSSIDADQAAAFKSNQQHKFNFYSVHDMTLNALLIALNMEHVNSSCPPFSASLIIELWKNNKNAAVSSTSSEQQGDDEYLIHDYFIRIFYCGKPVELTYHFDDTDHYKCSLFDFLTLLDETSIDRATFDSICN